MPAARVWIPTIFLSFLILHNAQSQMCEEPFQAALTLVTNVTYPASSTILDPEHVFYREILRFTVEEIDREREAAIQFFRDTYGLDFTNVEQDEQGQRILGNATFQPVMFPYNNTFVFNSWLVNPRARTRCFRVGDGGFRVSFSGTVMLHGEYGGEEGRMGFAKEPCRRLIQHSHFCSEGNHSVVKTTNLFLQCKHSEEQHAHNVFGFLFQIMSVNRILGFKATTGTNI